MINWYIFGVATLLAQACVATKAEFQVLDGKLSYLESRVEKNEDLVTDITGSARKEVLQTRRETQEKLEQARKQSAQLVMQVQQLQTEIQQLKGYFAHLESDVQHAFRAISEVTLRVASQPAQDLSQPVSAEVWKTETEIYKAAKTAMEQQNNQTAQALFAEQLRRWPDGQLAANALFWTGEILYRNEDYLKAIEKFLTVAEQHSKHNKAPAAYLKLGMSLERLGEKEQAIRTYGDLTKLYPNSKQVKAAEQAQRRLSK